jgi:hypothetical protein
MIETSIKDIIGGKEVFKKLAEMPLNIKAAYNIARIIREIEKENKTFEDTRQKLLFKYGEKDSSGQLIINQNNQITIIPEQINNYNKEIQELLNEKIKLNVEPISLNDLGEIQITPAEIYQINMFIKE